MVKEKAQARECGTNARDKAHAKADQSSAVIFACCERAASLFNSAMVQDDGSAKGLRTILRERGINTVTMKADDMRTVLSFHEDFSTENTIVEEYLKSRGHQVYFLPKFHCELNAIERVWGQAKVYCRAYTNFTISRLRQIVNPALDSVSVDLIQKFDRKARDYEQAYRDGHKAGKAVEDTVKLYNSHRRVFSERY